MYYYQINRKELYVLACVVFGITITDDNKTKEEIKGAGSGTDLIDNSSALLARSQ